MSKYVVCLKNGEHIVVRESDTPRRLAEQAMNTKTSVRLNGHTTDGAMIGDIKPFGSGDYGPHLSQVSRDATDIFQLAAGSPDSFWKRVFFVNGERKRQGKPWLHARCVEWAKRETSFTEPESLVEFIDAEWESAKRHNVPDLPKPEKDPEVKRLVKAFLETDEGREYVAKWKYS
jgi:hypothetical protein